MSPCLRLFVVFLNTSTLRLQIIFL